MNDTHILYTDAHKQLPVIARAKGMYLYDTEGREYLDCAAGIADRKSVV